MQTGDFVRLKYSIPLAGLTKGDVGVIVLVRANYLHYDVEFDIGKILTLLEEDLELVTSLQLCKET